MTVKEQFEGSLAITPRQPEVAMQVQPTPMGILEIAISKGADIDQLTKLLELKERWDAGEAKKAFIQAMAEFKRSSIRIIKDKDNGQYKSKYVSLGNLVNTVTPYLSENSLSARWDVDQSNPPSVKVTCIITHSAGHSESVSMSCPPDKSGAKNPIQEIKSAITYAKACTFESICGLASTDGNLDDDGNGSAANKGMDSEEFDRLMALLEGSRTFDDAKRIFAEAWKAVEAAKDDRSKKKFVDAYEQKKKELR